MFTFFTPGEKCSHGGIGGRGPHKNLQKNESAPNKKTRTKTSIRYAKENDKEKRERRKERERKVEGEI